MLSKYLRYLLNQMLKVREVLCLLIFLKVISLDFSALQSLIMSRMHLIPRARL
jgi:hypothetical protein